MATYCLADNFKNGCSHLLNAELYFVFPGNLNTNTGGYHYDRRVIEELRKMGSTVKTISLSEKFPFPDELVLTHTEDIFSSIPDDSTVIVDGLAFGAMEKVIKINKSRLCLIALCHHPLAMETGLNPHERELLLRSESYALRNAKHVIVTSQNTRKILIEDFSISASKITVALPGTDRYPFARCIGSPPKLLTCASLIKRKGHDILIEALCEIHDLNWQARFIGDETLDPKWASELRDRVALSGLSTQIEFVGTVANIASEYQNADIFVLPSKFEGYGMVLSEALAHGLPIISTRTGAIPEVVPESAGILVKSEDHSALAAALKKLILDGDLRNKMQLSAQKAASTLPSWAACAELIVKSMEIIPKR